jgi:long-chain acyl-CoA synthetase
MLERAMQTFADRPALRSFGQMLTYRDVDRQSRALAAFLQTKLGVKKGNRVAVMTPNILAFPLAMIANVRVGAIQVSVNPLYTPRELEHQLNDAGVETIILFSGSTSTLAEAIGATKVKNVIVAGLGDGSGANLPSPPVDPRLQKVVSFADALAQGAAMTLAPVDLSGDDVLFYNTPAERPASRRARRSPTATSSPTPNSSRRSCRRRFCRARRSSSPRFRSITSLR